MITQIFGEMLARWRYLGCTISSYTGKISAKALPIANGFETNESSILIVVQFVLSRILPIIAFNVRQIEHMLPFCSLNNTP